MASFNDCFLFHSTKAIPHLSHLSVLFCKEVILNFNLYLDFLLSCIHHIVLENAFRFEVLNPSQNRDSYFEKRLEAIFL